jgi:hypothetical protein
MKLVLDNGALIALEREDRAMWRRPQLAYACDGGDDWGCPSTTLTVQQVSRRGRSVIDNLAGQSFHSIAPIIAVATTDGPITEAERVM